MSDQGQVKDEKLDAEAEARRRVALAQIRQYPDPVLRMKANDVVEFDGDLTRLIERLEHLLQDANGLGLAATQIGVLRRVFIIQPEPPQREHSSLFRFPNITTLPVSLRVRTILIIGESCDTNKSRFFL